MSKILGSGLRNVVKNFRTRGVTLGERSCGSLKENMYYTKNIGTLSKRNASRQRKPN